MIEQHGFNFFEMICRRCGQFVFPQLLRPLVHARGQGPGADSEEKHEPVSDIDTIAVDSLKALDPKRPIREEKPTFCCATISVGMGHEGRAPTQRTEDGSGDDFQEF
jgi:hypothetical protein